MVEERFALEKQAEVLAGVFASVARGPGPHNEPSEKSS
jgi:hypothetical protein